MKLIVLTTEGYYPSEAEILKEMFQEGLEHLHVRKKNMPEDYWVYLLQECASFTHRISLHDYYHLSCQFHLKGLHFPAYRRNLYELSYKGKRDLLISTSLHTREEVNMSLLYDYAFFGPVFPSLSKQGYFPHYSLQKIEQIFSESVIPLVAIGGITVDKIPYLLQWPLYGVAVLGGIWNSKNPVREMIRYRKALENYSIS